MLFEDLFKTFCEIIGANNIALISQRFQSLSNDFERVLFVINLDEPLKCISTDTPSSSCYKDNERSSELRADGNYFFKNEQLKQALSKYTESICYANSNSKFLSLAYANRSAVLFRLKKYEETLKDIDLAIENNYPTDLLHKLLERKGDSLKAMQNLTLAKKYYKQAIELCNSQNQIRLIRIINEKLISIDNSVIKNSEAKSSELKIIPNFQCNPNATYPSLSSSCEVAYDNAKGRHIIASREIKPGEIVLIEKPFASILVTQRFLTHCHHCLVQVDNPLPCNSCVYSVFCSDQCRKDANHSFHKYECPIMGILDSSGLDKFSRLALRSILSVPINDISSYKMEPNQIVVTPDNKKERLYKWDDYGTICSLVTNSYKRSMHDLFKRSVIAVYLMRVLEKTPYFQENDNPEIKAQVAGYILSHLQSFPCNAHEISELLLNPSSVLTSEPRELGAGIYATMSLFNHSCNPVVTRNFYGDVCVIRAISKISKGSEITDNYGVVFQIHTKQERNEHLKPQYFFDCQCLACLENWPTFADELKKPPKFICDKCGCTLKTKATDNFVCCHGCEQVQDILVKKQGIVEGEKDFDKAYNLLLSNKPKEAISGICAYLEVLCRNVCEPWNEFARSQESLKQCFSMIANCCLNDF